MPIFLRRGCGCGRGKYQHVDGDFHVSGFRKDTLHMTYHSYAASLRSPRTCTAGETGPLGGGSSLDWPSSAAAQWRYRPRSATWTKMIATRRASFSERAAPEVPETLRFSKPSELFSSAGRQTCFGREREREREREAHRGKIPALEPSLTTIDSEQLLNESSFQCTLHCSVSCHCCPRPARELD